MRESHGDLFPSRDGSRKQHAREIDAGDQQHEIDDDKKQRKHTVRG